MRRGTPRYRSAPRALVPPALEVSSLLQSQRGAVVPDDQLRVGDATNTGRPRPLPWDLINIVAAPASGSTTTLIGPGAAQLGLAVPEKYRAYVDAICPYVEAAAGPVTSPRIPGVGVTMTWRVLIDGQPAPPYAAITTVLSSWEYVSPRPLLEVPSGSTMTVDVTNIDPLGTYLWLGIRVRCRWVPWDVGGPL